MNERIRELAVQAEKLADEATNAYNDDTGNWRKVWNEVYDEKFAQLIVEECAYIVENSPWRFKHGYKAIDQANLVKQHFGVE
jgi:hypothetical protein